MHLTFELRRCAAAGRTPARWSDRRDPSFRRLWTEAQHVLVMHERALDDVRARFDSQRERRLDADARPKFQPPSVSP